MGVPRLGVKLELQLLPTATVTATPDPSHLRPVLRLVAKVGFLTHWARPGIQLASSWTLCRVRDPLSRNGNSFQILVRLYRGESWSWAAAAPPGLGLSVSIFQNSSGTKLALVTRLT